METGDVAKRLGVTENTIRNWSGRFKRFLSDRIQSRPDGGHRDFTEEDVLVLATVAKHGPSGIGLTLDQVEDMLEKGSIESLVPPAPQVSEDRLRESVELTTRDQAEIEILRSQLNLLQQQVTQVIKERDEAVTAERDARRQMDKLHQQIHELERTMGDVKAEAARMEERAGRIPDLEAEVKRLRQDLEELERSRRRLFGR